MMRTALVVASVAVLLALSGAAAGQGMPLPSNQTFCIRHDGSLYRPHCTGSGCDCGGDYHITPPLCLANEPSAPFTPAANKARYAAAAAGRLETARYEGRRFCVRGPHQAPDAPIEGSPDIVPGSPAATPGSPNCCGGA